VLPQKEIFLRRVVTSFHKKRQKLLLNHQTMRYVTAGNSSSIVTLNLWGEFLKSGDCAYFEFVEW